MQNNAAELTHRLLRALDNNYNVIDMPAVIEVVSLLEKVSITKELLETTRLGKHVNELRRKTDNDSLSKRAKELVKKWRNMVLPGDANGQIKGADEKKRPAIKSPPVDGPPKRPKLNGTAELELSDNSNSSFMDTKLRRDVILINSDSNSSFAEARHEPLLDQQQPKKRGRKKGSKNHKNLLDEAETSFTNKLAVSRGNSKVKTTQELIAGLQNRTMGTSPVKAKEDLNLRAAKLTERVSIIDQKLNTNANRYKNKGTQRVQRVGVIESGSVINDKALAALAAAAAAAEEEDEDEEVIVVDEAGPLDVDTPEPPVVENKIVSLSVEEALALLPPIDRSVLLQQEEGLDGCTCHLQESVGEDEEAPRYDFVEDGACAARLRHEDKCQAGLTPSDLHTRCLANVNGNWGVGLPKDKPQMTEDGLYVNVVPNVNNESINDFSSENFKKYSISEGVDEESGAPQRTDCDSVFREWHEVLETPSYNGEIFKILPYVIID